MNHQWDSSRSVYAGDYILAVASGLMAKIRNEDVLVVLSQVLADLVVGEFQQLQNKEENSERFQLYLAKTFNKTASLIAYRYNVDIDEITQVVVNLQKHLSKVYIILK